MRSIPVVAFAALLACLPARAVDVIDIGATAQWPAHLPTDLPIGIPIGQPLNVPAEPSAPAFAYYPAHFPTHFLAYPMPSPHPPGPVPADGRAGMPSNAALADLALPAEGAAPAATVAEPTPVPEPVSVLMLAWGLLLMVPGAWATRWSRLGDSESLLQRRFP